MDRVKRVRPYSPRLDGAIGQAGGSPHPGGIFGQRISPANHTGIFESRYALPFYVEEAELQGGKLDPVKLKADVTTADPVERKIRVPDLGVNADNWRMPWPKQPKQPGKAASSKQAMLRKQAALRKLAMLRKRRAALGADPVITPSTMQPVEPASTPTPAPAPTGPSGGTIFGAAVCVAAGILIAKAVFSK
jgi:hypothetical protein